MTLVRLAGHVHQTAAGRLLLDALRDHGQSMADLPK